MTDWTAGYVADIGYTFGYYQELNPLRVKLAFLNAGLVPPEVGVACELGFGQGLSANVHAAASVTEWHGTDFNPAQAGFAQELAQASGAAAHLYDDAFADFAQRTDLPDFDYIGLHGIWSWISDENRHVIVEFIRRKLKVGGVLYISYNTLPGWAAFAPMRHLMTEHAEVLGSEGRGIVSRIDGALDFASKLIETQPKFAQANPLIGERIKALKSQNRHYLAHEYFNRDWHPMHFATMSAWLEPAKLNFACSAHFLDHVDAVNLSKPQQAFIDDIPDAGLRQSVRDFMVNQQFRKDYWVKGARKLSTLDQAESLRDQKIMLLTHRSDVAMKVMGALGEATLTESIYTPILDLLADHRPKSLGQLEKGLKDQHIAFSQLLQSVMVLMGAGHLAAVADDQVIAKSKKTTEKLNAHLLQKARGSGDTAYLASAVTGAGIALNRFQQLFVLASNQGKKTPEEWAAWSWLVLKMQDQKLRKEGAMLETDEENLAELTAQAKVFATKHYPVLKVLQVL